MILVNFGVTSFIFLAAVYVCWVLVLLQKFMLTGHYWQVYIRRDLNVYEFKMFHT